jgi:alpha-galactosidase
VKKIQSFHLNRRDLLLGATCSASLAAVPFRAQAVKHSLPFVDLREAPIELTAFSDLENARPLTRFGSEWRAGDLIVSLTNGLAGTVVSLSSPALALTHLCLRWRVHYPEDILVLGDAWERSYGDLGWRNVVAERALP